MIQLVTDRTETDVLLQTPKGSYSHGDLNRVEAAVEELAALLPRLDLALPLTVKTDWAPPEAFSPETWPTQNQMHRFLQNVHRLCDRLSLPTEALPDSMSRLTWQGANRIEQALEQAQSRAQAILQAHPYSGEFFAGEETIL